jgi:hypothetical protein
MRGGSPALSVAKLDDDGAGDADELDEEDEADATPEATDTADAWAGGAAPTEARTDDPVKLLCVGTETDADEAEEDAEDDAVLVAEFKDAVAGAGGRAPGKGPEWGPRLDDMLILLTMPRQL